jgi:DNA-binding CsgD family transcriptional regulator
VLDGVRAGQSRVLVLRGEPGVGKSALLGHLVQQASGCRVARAAGAEPEMELPYAGLHQLCAPMLDQAERLPGPQRDALATAFGLVPGPAPDRFLVGLAALGLLAAAAEERPLLCVVDDAQWQDRASAQILAFVARRLLAESVGLVFAVSEPGGAPELQGLPELAVGGLGAADARALLGSAFRVRMDEQVRERVVAETRGNPLALLELRQRLTPAELAGGFGLPGGKPPAGRVEQGFRERFESLARETRRLLVLAAAEPVGDVTLLWRAAERLGIGTDAVEPAESAGLIELGVRVRFRHPLVRSAVYGAASRSDRQQAHRALAEATDGAADPDRRAWHRAHAAAALDETLADELERSAGRAQARGGVAAAAAFLRRAAELTPDPARRAARALAAAQATFDAGAPDTAFELLATAEAASLDELERARRERLRARITFARTRGGDVLPLLLAAAGRLQRLDAGLARDTHLDAVRVAISAGRLGGEPGVGAAAAAAAAHAAPATHAIELLLTGLAARYADGYEDSVAPLRQALDAFAREDDAGEDRMRWLWLTCPVEPEPLAPDLWDDAAWARLAARAVRLAREAGALTVLPTALTYRAVVHLHAGELAAAQALVDEADAITEATGGTRLTYTSLALAAWRGAEAEASRLIEAGVRAATARGEGRAIGLAEYATAVLNNGLGRYEAALAAARRACAYDDLGFYGWSLIELVEAAARSGSPEAATAAALELGERTRAAGTDWALGVGACSQALVTDGPAADALYREATERLGRSRVATQLARAHLLHGEWLRRESRRLDAREQLRVAHELFAEMGAEAFAERARRELLATGETARRRTIETRDALTPQEAQIAMLARDGHTNTEIGSQLFISSRTVEYHLGKVFGKLGIRSRKELHGALPDAGRQVVPA